jgi:hypothetical protein
MDELPEWAKDDGAAPAATRSFVSRPDLPSWARDPEPPAEARSTRQGTLGFPVAEDSGATARSWLPSITENLNPFSESNVREAEHPSLLPTGPLKGLGALAGYAMSPLADFTKGAAHAAASPIEWGVKKLADAGYGPSPEVQKQANEGILEPGIESALGLAMPGRGGVPMPPRPTTGPFGVSLSAGEEAANVAMRQAEQQAVRQGIPHAQDWVAQRQTQLEAAKDRIASGFDPFGQQIAETPLEAGTLTQDALQRAAAARKAGVDTAYGQARAMPGEIHADVFRAMPDDIKQDLSLGPSPVIIDDRLTPFASQMIRDIDNRVGQLQIQNRASPFGQPNQQNIVGVNLEGVDQMRKRLSAFRNDAFASSTPTDQRAARAVLDAFDDHIDQAVNGGMFNGHPDAVQAWNDARAAHADYKADFFGSKKDPAGKVVEKILGRYGANPMVPEDVARYFTGGQGVTSNSLNVNVNRMKGILGVQSPEWAGVKQGVFRNLVERPGTTAVQDFGSGQIANRLGKFVNSSLASAIYAPQELQTLRAYADLMRRITMPPGSYFPSAPSINKVIDAVGSKLGTMVGSMIGGGGVIWSCLDPGA